MARSTQLSATHDQNALFKEFYSGDNDNALLNVKSPLASIIMKNKKVDFVGDQFVAPVRFGSAVGVGYRALGQNLPTPGAAPRGKAIFQAKRAYGTAEFDREAIKASRNDKGAFAKVTVADVEALEEGFMLHMIERALFSDGSGKLGEVASVSGAGTSASPWVIVGATTGTNGPKHKKRNYPQGARLDLYTVAGVYQMSIQVVSASSTTLTATTLATGSSATPVAADVIYWEGNKDGECVGLASIAPVSAGTLYGISQTTQPQMRGQRNAITGSIAFDDLNDIVADLEEEIGSPDLAICSHTAKALFKNQAEDAKRYSVAEIKTSNVKVGFKGIELMSDEGPFPLISSQMIPDDEIYFVNTKYLQLVMREDFGWFEDDGVFMLRDQNKDVYQARYGGYFELFCSKPNSVGRISGFTV